MIKTIRLRVIVSVSLDCFLQFSGAFGKSLVWGIVLFYLFPLFSIPALQAAAWGTALGNFLPDNLQPFAFRTLPVFLEGYSPVTDLKKIEEFGDRNLLFILCLLLLCGFLMYIRYVIILSIVKSLMSGLLCTSSLLPFRGLINI